MQASPRTGDTLLQRLHRGASIPYVSPPSLPPSASLLLPSASLNWSSTRDAIQGRLPCLLRRRFLFARGPILRRFQPSPPPLSEQSSVVDYETRVTLSAGPFVSLTCKEHMQTSLSFHPCGASTMSEVSLYPPIEPNTFDLIVIGTGLTGSLIAAAASASGKTAIHLDPNTFYGSHFASLPISELTSFLNSHSTTAQPQSRTDGNGQDYAVLDLSPSPLYSDVEISSYAPEMLLEHSRSFSIDLGGPRVFFCADKAIDLIVKSGAGQYLEFKSIDASFVCDENGRLWNVPDSRAAIFKDKTLGLTEKNQLMRFFKLVQQHLEASSDQNIGNEGSHNSRISEEDLESPFIEFLKKMRLPPKIKSIILYAIAMADYDQNDLGICKDILKTKDGIERLALYNRSVGRFTNASGALIYPMYGHGELSQAFCRRAAVKGCLYVLRMPVISLLMDKESGRYKGVRLASGQDLFSDQLVLDPTFKVSSQSDPPRESLERLGLSDVKGKVARGICVIASSLKQGISNFLVVYPPHSLYPEQNTSIRAMQIGGGLAVCPSGMFVLYFSALCDDAKQGKNLLRAAVNALLKTPNSENAESSFEVQNENAEVKPTRLWNAMYIQELTTGQLGQISSTPMPDGSLNYNDILDATMKLFQEMYPDGEFFTEMMSPEDVEDEGELSLES